MHWKLYTHMILFDKLFLYYISYINFLLYMFLYFLYILTCYIVMCIFHIIMCKIKDFGREIESFGMNDLEWEHCGPGCPSTLGMIPCILTTHFIWPTYQNVVCMMMKFIYNASSHFVSKLMFIFDDLYCPLIYRYMTFLFKV